MSNPPPRCVTCDQPVTGRFCAHCGEKRLVPTDHTLIHIVGHVTEAFTQADGKIFLTLRTLVTRPGQLTADDLRGRRKPYVAPLQLFLIANLIFFLLHPFIGSSNLLTTDLDTHLHYLWHSELAQSLVTPRLAARSLSVNAYAAIFNPAAVIQAKTLVILIVPIFALAPLVLYWRHRRPCAAHLVFAFHVCAFWLLFICFSLTLTNLVLRLLRAVHVFPSAEAVVWSTTAFSLAIMTAYLFRAVRVAFPAQSVWTALAKAAALSIALQLSLQAYRFVLFFTTFWST